MSPVELRIGISRCLMGDEVRYDAGHKRNDRLMNVFGPEAHWVKVCPEVEVGMGTPREPVHLIGVGDGKRMLGVRSQEDWTDRMKRFASKRAAELSTERLDGFVLKSRSPSCGIHDGLFAEELTKAMPLLPVAEEAELEDPAAMDGFIERVFGYRRMTRFFSVRRTVGNLVMFHSQNKIQLEVHEPGSYERLSDLVSDPHEPEWSSRARQYQERFTAVLSQRATEASHLTALRAALRHLPADAEEAVRAVDRFEAGQMRLPGALMAMSRAIEQFDPPMLYMQSYLTPAETEMVLRNRAWL